MLLELVHCCQDYLNCNGGVRFLDMFASPGCNGLVPLLRYVVLVGSPRNTAMVAPVVQIEISCQMAGVSIRLGLCLAGGFPLAFGGISCHGCIHAHWGFLKTGWRLLLVPLAIILLFQ